MSTFKEIEIACCIAGLIVIGSEIGKSAVSLVTTYTTAAVDIQHQRNVEIIADYIRTYKSVNPKAYDCLSESFTYYSQHSPQSQIFMNADILTMRAFVDSDCLRRMQKFGQRSPS